VASGQWLVEALVTRFGRHVKRAPSPVILTQRPLRNAEEEFRIADCEIVKEARAVLSYDS
jgi:hypothetical protein